MITADFIQITISYLFCGVVFSFLFDLLRQKVISREKEVENELPWGNTERIVTIILWPLALILFVIGALKIKDKENEE